MPVRMRVGRADIDVLRIRRKEGQFTGHQPRYAGSRVVIHVIPLGTLAMTPLSRCLLFAALAMLVACPLQGTSAPVPPGNPVALSLVDETGSELPVYGHRGQHWVPGQPGRGYQVRLTNHSDRRVLVVLSIDGVNAISGQTAAPNQTGYVLDAWQSADIDGWRKSMDEAARFVFTDLPDSYAARTGRPDNVGVVGIAVFAERVYRPVYPMPAPITRAPGAERAANEVVADAASAPQQRIGTGHGERTWSPVQDTRFVRASHRPIQLTELRYDDESGLRAAGVLPRYQTRYPRPPRAFPSGFVPDPPND